MNAPEGFQNYEFWQPGMDAPHMHKRIELWRPEWAGPRVVDYDRIPPEMNVIGLYWRPHD